LHRRGGRAYLIQTCSRGVGNGNTAVPVRPAQEHVNGNFLQVTKADVWCASFKMRRRAVMSHLAHDLISVLHAAHADPDRAEKLQLYGQFIGDWDSRIVAYAPDGTRHESSGEIHFGWILQGRAIQDVWMIPRLEERPVAARFPIAGNWYGTTLRIYDPTIDAWRIYWLDPATNAFRHQIGRPRGDDIVQEGKGENGALSRWSFTEIRPDSFHWLGEASADGGTNWRLLLEVFARRRNK
jgi:hypothetical protein